MEYFAWFLDFVLHIDVHLTSFILQYGVWVYAFLFVIIFCETGLVVTPFLPGDSLLFASGVASGSGLCDPWLIVMVLLLAGVSGDACNYTIGRKVGPMIFQRESRFIKKAYLLKAHAFYERHGGKAIILARFIPIVRTFAPFVAGIALMQPVKFLLYNISGCLLWVGSLVAAGFFLGSLPWVKAHFSVMVYAIIAVSLLPLLIGSVQSRLRKS
ncbi:MAG: DedA family protein [Desulfovibrio sp.]|nr:DedA family protein [Desulfovibrio sp.]